MWPYFLMFLVPAAAASAERTKSVDPNILTRGSRSGIYIFSVIMIIAAGLRFEVGGDWFNYIGYFERASALEFNDAIEAGMEPAYYLANQLGLLLGIGVYAPNIICAIVFFCGLAAFCLSMPRPWLAIAVATPYLGIVVGMGYSRQAAALGFVMLAYRALGQGSLRKFVVLIVLGALFHKTAVIVIPVAILAGAQNRVLSAIWLGVVGVIGYRVSLESSMDHMVASYVGGTMQSSGALVRLVMNALPGVIYLRFRDRIGLKVTEEKLWYWISWISVMLLTVLLIYPTMSTAIDRIALYFLPIQIVVFSYLPAIFTRHRYAIIITILLYMLSVLIVWLNFAANAYAWLPYQFYPLD